MSDRLGFDFNFDCVVVGSGHAGSCAAFSAAQSGCKNVLVVEKAPKEWAGGNGYFTAGAHRTVHSGLQDVLPLVSNVTADQASKIDMSQYTEDEFREDIMRLTDRQTDPELVDAVVKESRQTIEWLARDIGVNFMLSFNRQAYEVDGRQKFWGGMVLSVKDGGKGLIDTHHRNLSKHGIEVWYESPAVSLIHENNEIVGLIVRREGKFVRISANAVILAAGGFESSSDQRAKYLGEKWRKARVRGTPYNTGDGISLAHSVGAKLVGDWSDTGCHSTCWDANAPGDRGDRLLSNQFTKSGYPLGIMINVLGERFVDEGEDFRNYTYARFGRAILDQPEGVAFQVFDAKAARWLREEEYGDRVTRKIHANTLDELVEILEEEGLRDREAFLRTIENFNVAVDESRREDARKNWNPAVKDGLSTNSSRRSIIPPKSNWAIPLREPPFLAVKVACGITFTFGGVAIDPETTEVISKENEKAIAGLFCTGEMVGGLFYGNYPGGSGLTAGAVLGRKAGKSASYRVFHDKS